MASFYDVTAGNATMAADINQYADRFNGTTSAQAKLLTLNNATSALQGILSAAPTADQNVYDALVSGDLNVRLGLYVRGADGYAGIRAGAGSAAPTAHLYAQASGWKIDEALTVAGALNVSGTATLGGISASSLSVSGSTNLAGLSSGGHTVTGGLTVTGSSSLDNGNITTNGSGGIFANAPITLRSGNQETGFMGQHNDTPTGGKYYGCTVNFKTTLTNTPTSIPLNAYITSSGWFSLYADSITKYGFRLMTQATSSSPFDVSGTYTTAGNCLLGVDEAARTFDHHCDNPACGRVSRALPLTALDYHDAATGYHATRVAFAYRCPECGWIEAFDTSVTAEDEADTAIQGYGEYATTRGTQARYIRQLCALLAAARAAGELPLHAF